MSSLPVPVSLDSTLRHLGSADPRRPFLIDAREPERPLEYTWGDADRQVDALAEQIAAHACRSVGVLLDNSYRNLCLIYAVMRAGKHLVLIDPEWGGRPRSRPSSTRCAWTRWPANIRSRARWPGCAWRWTSSAARRAGSTAPRTAT
ncbi:hypothetical protein QOU08_03010 [Pseudomonas aeruginosa]